VRSSASRDIHPAQSGSENIDRTPDPVTSFVEYVRINHGRADIGMPQELLNRPDVVAGLKQVSGPAECGINSRVAKGVAAYVLYDSGLSWSIKESQPTGIGC